MAINLMVNIIQWKISHPNAANNYLLDYRFTDMLSYINIHTQTEKLDQGRSLW